MMPEDEEPQEIQGILKDIETLREKGLIEVVGINEEGEWLYGLSPTAKQLVTELRGETDDPWSMISALMSDIQWDEE